MSYYIFRHTTNSKKIGKHYPQSSEMSSGYPYNEPDSVWQIRDKRLSFTPNLDAFVLNGQSKKTDIISAVALNKKYNVLIKPELIKIWKNLNVCEYQVFPATIVYRRKKFDYSLLHFYSYHNEYIDFKKSNFFYGVAKMKKVKDLEINSKEEYNNVKRNIQAEKSSSVFSMNDIHLSKLVLDEKNINLDFFLLKDQFSFSYIVSEKFKEALLTEKVTGFDLFNINEYRFENPKI